MVENLEDLPRLSSSNRERYLLALYKLQRRNGHKPVSMGDLARALEVTPGTATTMVKRLSSERYLAYEPYAGVGLTDAGRRSTLQLVRRHRLLECFLVQELDYAWTDVHAEVELLEHGVSSELLARIDEKLGFPKKDPHGHPIPSADGELATDDAVPLSSCEVGSHVRFSRIGEVKPALLDLLTKHGWHPGATGKVQMHDAIAETVQIQTATYAPLTISLGNAEHLFVEMANTPTGQKDES